MFSFLNTFLVDVGFKWLLALIDGLSYWIQNYLLVGLGLYGVTIL